MTQSSGTHSKVGRILWQDLTVPDAGPIRAFYEHVIGWKGSEHPMGDYADFDMKTPGDNQTVAGICHARGTNASVPPQWLIYFGVKDMDRSIAEVTRRGGRVIDGPRPMGSSMFAVIQDPAGAMCALMEVE